MRDVEWGGDRAASLPPPLCADGGDFHSTRQGSRPPLSARECLLIVFFLGSLPSLLRLRIWKLQPPSRDAATHLPPSWTALYIDYQFYTMGGTRSCTAYVLATLRQQTAHTTL